MNIADMEHELNGTTPMQKCNDLYTLLGAVKGRDYKCPNCGKWHDDDDGQYKVAMRNILNGSTRVGALQWMAVIGIGTRYIVVKTAEQYIGSGTEHIDCAKLVLSHIYTIFATELNRSTF